MLASFYAAITKSQPVHAATNSTINFQARLLTAAGNTVPDGQYNVEFKLYNALSSIGSSQGSCSGDTACLWTETRLTSNKVRVANGYLTVNLGSVTAFSSTINWDQELWLTMNIGGTGTATWDGEMTPRLKLTSVPYAFRAGQLANTNGANLSTLGWATQTTSNSILLPNEAGTLCIQNSTNCGFLTSSTGDANYVKLQGSTPGTPQTGNLNISGTGIFGAALQAPIFDRASAGALQIGTTNATSISLQQNTTLASGKSLTLQGGFAMTPSSDSTSVFNVRTSAGNNMFTIDTQFARVGIGLGSSNVPTLQDAGLEIKGSIRLSGANGTYSDAYITPKVGGGSVNSLINIVNYNPGQYGQLIAMGLPSNAHDQSRAISLFDARTTAHQPTIAVFDPSQNQLGGFSWDGSNVGTDGVDSIFYTKTSSNNMALQANGLDIVSLQKVGSVARVGIGNGSPSYPLDVTGDINSSTALRVGGTQVCTSSGCTPVAGSGNYIQNNATATSQTANFNIQGANTSTNTATIRSVLNQDNDLLQFQSSTGTPVAGIRPSGAIYSAAVSNPITDVPANARLFVQPVSNASTAIIARAASGGAPTGDIMQLQNASGSVNVFKVGVAGATTINSTSANALLVQNTSGGAALTVDTSTGRVGIGNSAPTVALDVGPVVPLGVGELVQVRIGDFLLQSQGGSSNGLAALKTRNSNGNLTLDGDSAATLGLLLSPFTTNNNFLAAGGGNVRVGDTNVPNYKLDVAGDINSSAAIRVGGTSVCDTTGSTGCVAKTGTGYYIHNQATVQSANLYVQAATTGSVAAKFQAFNGGSGNIAEFLNGTGTTVGTIGSTGTVLFKPSADSPTAFQVQPSGSSTPVLNLDTQNSRVGIGTDAPTRTFHTLVNNTQTTAPMALLEQTSTGDVTLEFKSPSKSYIIGQDASDAGKFKISSSTASASPTLFGKTTIGASEDSGDNNVMECAKFTTGGSAGNAGSMSVYERGAIDGGGNNLWQAAIYTDNGSGSNPVNLIASSASATLVADSWNTVSISASLAASTIYWLCANTNSTSATLNNWAYDNVAGAASWKAQTFGTWPANFTTGGGVGSATTQFSFYVTYTPGGSYDSYTKSLMSLGETGQTTFQNSTDSTTAFQVQNAAGTTLFGVDSTNSRLQIGPTAGNTTGTLLVLGNKTNTGDPTGVAGAMYYNSNSGNFRCFNAGAWQNCVGGLLSSNTAASSAISNCTGACAALSTNAAIPANYCQPGRVITITASGVYSNAAATTPGLSLGVYYGTDASVRANDVLIGTASPSLVPVTAGLSNAGWRLDFTIICNSTTVMNGQGRFMITSNATAGSINAVTAIMGTTGTSSVTTTTNKNLYIFPTWSAASASNSITVQQLIVTGT